MGDFCSIAEPRRPSAAEVAAMADSEKRKVLSHNEYGENKCGWKP